MARRSSPPPKAADWQPEKTLSALRKQQTALELLKGRHFREVEHLEHEWEMLTGNIINHGFGEGSQNALQFFSAHNVGEHYVYEVEDYVHQSNYEKRMNAYSAVLKSCISELELMLPDATLAGAYQPGEEYKFYRDLKEIVGFAGNELFVVDNYLDTELFDVYMENVNAGVKIRVLTNQVSGSLLSIAQKFSKRGNFELRSSKDVHDRVVFADDRCWVIGQSIKDAAKKKPTYIVEHPTGALMRGIYDPLWAAATIVV